MNECLKSLISEHLSTVNMLKGAKHCWNLYTSTFIIFLHHSEGNWKCLFSWYLKSHECLLIHWLPMTFVLLVVVRIYHNNFKCNYLKKQFPSFFAAFLKFISKFELFEKMMAVIAYVFPKLQTAKDVVRQIFKKSRFRAHFNMLKGPKIWWNLHGSTFIIYLNQSDKSWVGKCLS